MGPVFILLFPFLIIKEAYTVQTVYRPVYCSTLHLDFIFFNLIFGFNFLSKWSIVFRNTFPSHLGVKDEVFLWHNVAYVFWLPFISLASSLSVPPAFTPIPAQLAHSCLGDFTLAVVGLKFSTSDLCSGYILLWRLLWFLYIK